MKEELILDFKHKVLKVKKEKDGFSFSINDKSVFIPQSSLFEVLSLLDSLFYGVLRENKSVQGTDGYLVFLRGQDKWGIRIGKDQDREVVYLSRVDIRTIYYFLLLS